MKILLFFITAFLTTGCVSPRLTYNVYQPISKVFYTDYDKVWKALMLTMESYSVEEEDQEKGFLRTARRGGNKLWTPPFPEERSLSGTRSDVIVVYLTRGQKDSVPGVRVSVLKKSSVRKGFLTEAERVPSHGLEEKVILYRILREIEIEEFIMKQHKQKTPSPSS